MSRIERSERLEDKRICYDCVGESFLSAEIKSNGEHGLCSYCNGTRESIDLDDFADRIGTAFDQHYVRTRDEPTSYQYAMLKDKEEDYWWDRDGEPVIDAIANAADISEEAAKDAGEILDERRGDYDVALAGEETEFSADSYYDEGPIDDAEWHSNWRFFEQSLKTEARFFSRSAMELLESIFGGIDELKTRDGQPLVIDAGPDCIVSHLYRARVFQNDDDLETALTRPDSHLGPPPPKQAISGRMNATGISVFYSSNTPEVALAEVRPPVGSQVAVARFNVIRPLRLLDLTSLRDIAVSGSVFDPAFADRLARKEFLKSLSGRITLPVMPDDEAFEYLATQAIADYLATENNPRLDGIAFPSVQVKGRSLNFVLFHKAARVKALEFPKGTDLSASLGHGTEDGWEVDYTVIENVPPGATEAGEKSESTGTSQFLVDLMNPDYGYAADSRDPTLEIDLDSVGVHIVESVDFKSTGFPVTRFRWEKGHRKF